MHFCEVYAREYNGTTEDSDTGVQVFVEAQLHLGYLLAVAFDIHNMLCALSEDGDSDASSLIGLNKLFSEFKSKWLMRHTFLLART